MAVTKKQLVRVFEYNKKILEDPNPKLSPEAIMNAYSNQYADLLNAEVEGPEIKEGKAVYKFSKNVGKKG